MKHFLVPVNTPTCNTVYNAPKGQDETVLPLNAEVLEDSVITTWKIDKEALMALLWGKEIKIEVSGKGLPPMRLYVEEVSQ